MRRVSMCRGECWAGVVLIVLACCVGCEPPTKPKGEAKKPEAAKSADQTPAPVSKDAPVPKPEEKAAAKPEAKPEVKAEPKPEAKPEAKAEPKPEAKPEMKPEAKPEAKSAPKPEAKPAAKPETKPEPKPEAKPAAKPEAKAEVKGTPMTVKVPKGLPELPIPADNPMTVEKVELGKQLYFDKRVSKDGTVACATCHDPKMAWAEHEPTSTGIHKQVGGRNSPTVINAAYATSQFWDGRAATLEEQAVGPVANPIEMGNTIENMVASLSKIQAYEEQFKKVFGTGVTEKGFAQAIAAFERTVLSGDSPYDRFKAGDQSALNDAQKRGMALFETHCSSCHSGQLFSSYRFYNAGVGKPEDGRKAVTKKDSDAGKFRVPSLREVAKTGPYFHDGSVAKLEDAVNLMASGGKDNPNLSESLKSIREAKLTDANKKDLVEFLNALSGTFPVIEPPKLP